jgi:AraC-like DNA-binding protein
MKFQHPAALEGLFHYHQPAQSQPGAHAIPEGRERVELVTGGRGWVDDQKSWREVLAGDLLWHAPGDRTIGRSDPADPYHCLAITFKIKPARAVPIARFSHWPAIDEIQSFAVEAVRLFLDDSFDRTLLCDYLFTRLLFQVRVDQQKKQHLRLPDPLRLVTESLERDFVRPWKISEMARLAGLSEAHFHENFRRSLGVTPHQWLLRRRLRAVRERLLSSSDAIKKIAVECGFADSASLAHTFGDRFGLSPRAFRERYVPKSLSG